MGKGTDKSYITHSEWALDFGGAKTRTSLPFKRLPFDACALSLQPFENPVCTQQGTVYELLHILPFLKVYKTDPVSGRPLSPKDLIKLHFYKSPAGEYHCPVTFKVFNEHTHLVAIKSTGNVYSYDALKTLVIQPKNWRDLLTDEPISRSDFITLQDPHALESRNIADFHYYKNNLKVLDQDQELEKQKVSYKLNASGTTSRVLSEMASTASAKESKITPSFVVKEKKDNPLLAHYTTGKAAAALTSMSMNPFTKIEVAKIDPVEYMIKHAQGKGYATLQTNLGDINVELYCTETPRTCYNFIALAKKGYYRDVPFHRNIKNFMLQGGDPTGTGKGGESIYGKPFKDELHPKLSHDSRGILSMANAGPDTNNSQFFITYRVCSHLNYKHTVFGKVVGGLDVLTKTEQIPSGNNDKPLQKIMLLDVIVYTDPFEEVLKALDDKDQKERELKERTEQRLQRERLAKQARPDDTGDTSVGKYLSATTLKRTSETAAESTTEEFVPPVKKKTKARGFDFSAW